MGVVAKSTQKFITTGQSLDCGLPSIFNGIVNAMCHSWKTKPTRRLVRTNIWLIVKRGDVYQYHFKHLLIIQEFTKFYFLTAH
jgi:hypothetical protein